MRYSKAFHQHYRKKTVKQMRYATSLGIFLYAIFGLLDPYVVFNVTKQVWFIRYAIVCPACVLMLLITYRTRNETVLQIMGSLCMFLAGAGIAVMMLLNQGLGTIIYYGGLLLVLFYTYTFFRLRFYYATITGWAITLFYLLSAIFIRRAPSVIILNNMFFFVSANLIGMSVAYLLEAYIHSEYKQSLAVRLNNRELKNKTMNLVSVNRELEAFTYSVSNDLGAFLNLIDGLCQNLIKGQGERLSEDGKQILSLMSKDVQKISGLIKDLLTFSRVSKQGAQKTKINMNELIEKVFEEVKTAFPHHNVGFTPEPVHPVFGDKALLRAVLVKLVMNAFKVTIDRDGAQIVFGGWTDGVNNTYFVKDNGMGFDASDSERIFNVFYEPGKRSPSDADMMSLAVVHHIIMRLGGRLWAKGKSGEGATIFFSLPAR